MLPRRVLPRCSASGCSVALCSAGRGPDRPCRAAPRSRPCRAGHRSAAPFQPPVGRAVPASDRSGIDDCGIRARRRRAGRARGARARGAGRAHHARARGAGHALGAASLAHAHRHRREAQLELSGLFVIGLALSHVSGPVRAHRLRHPARDRALRASARAVSGVALLAPLAHAHRLRSEAQFELCGLFVIGLSLSRIFDSLFVFGSGSTASRAPTSPSAPCSVFAYGCGSSPAARAAWSAPTRRRARAACPFPASRPAVSGGFRLTAFATYCGAVNAIDSGMFAPVSELRRLD